jgi:hypothetical protein
MMNSLRKYKVLLNCIDGSRVGEKMCKRRQEVGSLKRKDRRKCGQSTTLVRSGRILDVRLIVGELNMGICLDEKIRTMA